MSDALFDLVRDTTTTTGTGNITLSGTPPVGFVAFAAVNVNGDTFFYRIGDPGSASEWEVGLGTLLTATTFARTSVFASSAGGAAVNFSSGPKSVVQTAPAFLLNYFKKHLGASVTKSTTGADVILTVSEAQNGRIIITGSLATDTNVIIPLALGATTAMSGGYIVDNQTTGGRTLTVKTAVSGSTGVLVGQGASAEVWSDGTNVKFTDDCRLTGSTNIDITAGVISLTGVIPAARGGTGQSSFTNGQLLIGKSSDGTLNKATLTQGTGITITNGDGVITIATSGGSGTVTSVNGSGGSTGLTLSGGPITASGTLTLAGTLNIANGGTGSTSSSGARTNLGLGDIATQNASTMPSLTSSGNISATGFLAGSNYYGFGSASTGIYGSGGSNVGCQIGGSVMWSAFSAVFQLGPGISAIKDGTSTWIISSDRRVKKKIKPYHKGLEALRQLKPISFEYNGKRGTVATGKRHVGLIAQDVLGTDLADMVSTGRLGPGSKELLVLDNGELIYTLLNAVIELSDRLEAKGG